MNLVRPAIFRRGSSSLVKMMQKTNVWRRLVQKVLGSPQESLGMESCFEDYRAMVEGWRLNVEGFVDYAKKVPEQEVLKELRILLKEPYDFLPSPGTIRLNVS